MEDPEDEKKPIFYGLKNQVAKFRKKFRPSKRNSNLAKADVPEASSSSPKAATKSAASPAENQLCSAENLDEPRARVSTSAQCIKDSSVHAVTQSKSQDDQELLEDCQPLEYALEIWEDAFREVKKDKQMEMMLDKYEKQVKKLTAKARKDGSTGATSKQQWTPKELKNCLQKAAETLEDSGKHEKARSNILKILTVVGSLNSFVAGVLTQNPPAAIAWSAICAAIPFIVRPIESKSHMVDGLEHILDMAPTYFSMPDQLLKASRLASVDQSLKSNLQNFYETILRYVITGVCQMHNRRVQQYWDTISGSVDWEKQFARLKADENALLGQTIPMLQRQMTYKITEKIAEILKKSMDRQDIADRREFLSRLHSRTYERRLDSTKTRLTGTCQWFRQDPCFNEWISSNGSLLLVSADTGCGKSVLAKHLIEEVLPEEVPDATICYFFFKSGDTYSESFQNASQALLYQLLTVNHDLIDGCRDKFNDNPNGASLESIWSQFRVATESQDTGPIICVLDALDEGDKQDLKDFMKHLKRYFERTPKTHRARFLVMTQKEPQIIGKFKDWPGGKIYLDYNDDRIFRKIQDDINIVMINRLNDLPKNNYTISKKDLPAIKAALIDQSAEQRTYLWMYLMFDVLEDYVLPPYLEWADFFENPLDVFEAYEKLLKRVDLQGESEEDKRRSRQSIHIILALILAAERPLTVEELRTAHHAWITSHKPRHLDLDDPFHDDAKFEGWCKERCGSFIYVQGNRVYLLHKTARDFLIRDSIEGTSESQSASTIWRGSMTGPVIHRYMAESCISLLSLDRFRNREFLCRLNIHKEDMDKNSHERASLDPFMEYAAVNWMHHFRKCQRSLPNSTVEDVGMNFWDHYISLFTRQDDKDGTLYGDLTQDWFSVMRASKPVEMFPSRHIMGIRQRKLSSKSLNVARIACLFDHRRLLEFALRELKEVADGYAMETFPETKTGVDKTISDKSISDPDSDERMMLATKSLDFHEILEDFAMKNSRFHDSIKSVDELNSVGDENVDLSALRDCLSSSLANLSSDPPEPRQSARDRVEMIKDIEKSKHESFRAIASEASTWRERRYEVDSSGLLPHFAAYGDSYLCLIYLKSCGYDMNHRDHEGQTPLHQAAATGNKRAFDTLTTLGAATDILDFAQRTPLTYGIICRQESFIKDHIESWGSHDLTRTLLRFAAIAEIPKEARHDEPKFTQEIIKFTKPGADSNTRTKRLIVFAYDSPMYIFRTLGIDLDLRCDGDLTALHVSAQDGRRILNTVFLLEDGADMYAVNDQGDTPLHTAAKAGNVLAIRILMNYGVKVDHKGSKGDTALHIACKNGHREAARALLGGGANQSIGNEEGLTALDVGLSSLVGIKVLEFLRRRATGSW